MRPQALKSRLKKNPSPNAKNVLSRANPFFLLLFLTSCSSLSVTQATGKTFTLPGSYLEVWQITSEVLAKEEIPILMADKTKGYIETQTFSLYQSEYKKWAKKPLFAPSGFCMLKIGIVKQTKHSTTLAIQAFFRRKHGFYFFGFRKKDESRGIFEALLAGRVNDMLIKRQIPKLSHVVVGCSFRYAEHLEKYIISDVEPGGLGLEQGLRNGDILLKIDGKEINQTNLFKFLSRVEREEIRTFRLKRGKKEVELSIHIYYVQPPKLPVGMMVVKDHKTGKFRIADVTPNSRAEKADLRIGDFLLEENGIVLDSWRNYYHALVSEKLFGARNFLIERDGTQTEKKVEII